MTSTESPATRFACTTHPGCLCPRHPRVIPRGRRSGASSARATAWPKPCVAEASTIERDGLMRQLMIRQPTMTAALLLVFGRTMAAQPAPSTGASACAALTQLEVPGVALAVTKAEWVPLGAPAPGGRGVGPPPAKLPAYCRLDGVIDRRTGATGATYGIRFALALPENWNGRFLFQGGGGLNGSVQPPLGGSAAGGNPGLARGVAVVSTDTGHQGRGSFDGSFRQDQQASLDFAYAAVGRVAEVAKRIIAQHYGKPPDRSYCAARVPWVAARH